MNYPVFFLCLFIAVGSALPPPILPQIQTIECAGTKFFDTYMDYVTWGCDFHGLKKDCCATPVDREQFKQCASLYFDNKINNPQCFDQVISNVEYFYYVSHKLVYIMNVRTLIFSIVAMIVSCGFIHFWRRR